MKSIHALGTLILVFAIQACARPSSESSPGASQLTQNEADAYGYFPGIDCAQAGAALAEDFGRIVNSGCESASDCTIGTAQAGSDGCVSSDWGVMNKDSVEAFQDFVCSAEFAKFMRLGSWNCWLVEPIAPPPSSEVVCLQGTCQLSGI